MSHARRVFVDLPPGFSPEGAQSEIVIAKEEAHHLRNVLRLRAGALLTVVGRQSGAEYQALVTASEEDFRVKVLSRGESARGPSRVDSLVFGLSKGAKNDLVCEKACELGVRRIIFWESQRSVAHFGSERERTQKLSRWQRLAEAAATQSAKNYIPQILAISDLDALLCAVCEGASPNDRFFCCSLDPQAVELRNVAGKVNGIHLLVGPEGDLTLDEESAVIKSGFELISLGPYVLRSETAAISAVAMVEGIWGSGMSLTESHLGRE
jgi:16S rRNA (uracil1498-N3)-methyltransferase